jgi:hypothetical protein
MAFSHPEKEKLLEVIPLSEIVGIQDMAGLGTADLDDDTGRMQLEITLSDIHCSCFFTNCFARQSILNPDEKEKCRKIFDSIDTDKTGVFSIDKINMFLEKMRYSVEEIENVIKAADADSRGEMTFDEFWDLQVMTDQNRRNLNLKVKVIKAENILNTGCEDGGRVVRVASVIILCCRWRR